MLYLAFEKVTPLKNHLEVTKTNLVSEVDRLNATSQSFAEHPHAKLGRFGCLWWIFDNCHHVSETVEALAEV